MKARRGPPPKLHHDLSTSKTSAADEDLFFDAVQLLGAKVTSKESSATRNPGDARSQAKRGPKGAKRQGAAPQSALSPAEAQLFEDAMAGLDRAGAARTTAESPSAPIVAAAPLPVPFELNVYVEVDLDADALAAALDGEEAVGALAAEPDVAPAPAPRPAARSDVISDKQFRSLLDKGRMHVASEIDLHGMTLIAAHDAVQAFMAESLKESVKVVRIVHGKGMHSRGEPVLRDLVRRLLRHDLAADILAMTSPPERMGGDGATVCLLRTSGQER